MRATCARASGRTSWQLCAARVSRIVARGCEQNWLRCRPLLLQAARCCNTCWAEAPVKIARMTLTAKLDGNWSSFQLANNTPPLSVTGSVIAPSARILAWASAARPARALVVARVFVAGRCEAASDRNVCAGQHHNLAPLLRLPQPRRWEPKAPPKIREVTLMRPFHGNL